MVHSGYHPLRHRPLRIVFGWCTVDIILKHSPLRVVFGWCTVDIILLSIVLLVFGVLLGLCLDGAQWISSS